MDTACSKVFYNYITAGFQSLSVQRHSSAGRYAHRAEQLRTSTLMPQPYELANYCRLTFFWKIAHP
jgi:hypothetical protein